MNRTSRWQASRRSVYAFALVAAFMAADRATAQQVAITTPVVNVRDSFFERIGLGWQFERGNFFFNFPGLNAAPPQFGGWDPASDARIGFGGRNGNSRWGFNLALQQGNTRSITGAAPTVVVPNGYGGSIFDGQLQPFVAGLIPVVGNRDQSALLQRAEAYRQARANKLAQWREVAMRQQAKEAQEANSDTTDPRRVRGAKDDAPLAIGGDAKTDNIPVRTSSGGSRTSSATHGDVSVTELKRRNAAEDQQQSAEVAKILERARGAEELGKTGVAKIFYRQAVKRATGKLQQEIIQKIKSLQ